jgi:Flp pilus assembly protein TadD
MIAIVLLAGVAAVAWRWRRTPPVAFATVFFVVTLLPMSNLLFPIGVGKAERILYLPSVGLCLLVAAPAALLTSTRGRRRILYALGIPILIALTVRTIRRNGEWQDQLTLALATLRDSPTSPLMSDIGGVELAKRNDLARAVPLLRQAVRRAPEISLYHQHLGTAYYTAGQLGEAERELAVALRIQPDDPDTHNNLGVVYLARQQLEPAKVEFMAALRANPNQVDAHSNLGFVYMRLGQVNAAARELREALRLQPNHPSARRILAGLYSQDLQRAPASK